MALEGYSMKEKRYLSCTSCPIYGSSHTGFSHVVPLWIDFPHSWLVWPFAYDTLSLLRWWFCFCIRSLAGRFGYCCFRLFSTSIVRFNVKNWDASRILEWRPGRGHITTGNWVRDNQTQSVGDCPRSSSGWGLCGSNFSNIVAESSKLRQGEINSRCEASRARGNTSMDHRCHFADF